MLSADGCRQRRKRLWARVGAQADAGHLLLADPLHVMYLAGFWVDPINIGASFGGLLRVGPDGHGTLIHDSRLSDFAKDAHADETRVVPWYDGHSPPAVLRRLALEHALHAAGEPTRVHDQPDDPLGPTIIEAVATLRRQKDPDEVAVLRRCMQATAAGHAWARQNIRPGMTELDVYCGVEATCTQEIGQPVVVYGDFAVSPGPERRGGGPSARILQQGDLFILDYSVVIGGYRSDFTNTLAVGKQPTPGQRRLFDLCTAAMAAGEAQLRGGRPCVDVYNAVRGVFETAGVAEHFPHHVGHGLGLTHPENPFLVRHATETLLPGDVVTLEPGLYVPGVGGLRIENNYLITAPAYERLSVHTISLT